MTRDHDLIAYLATLAAIVALVAIAALLAALGKYSEAIGVGAAVTGLIGVIKLPSSAPTGRPNDPVTTRETLAPGEYEVPRSRP